MNTRALFLLALALIAPRALPCAAAYGGGGTVTIDILKFYDANANGVYDNEPPQRGVTIAVRYTPPGGSPLLTTVMTDMTGGAWVFVPPGSTFVACERIPMSATAGQTWSQTMPNASTSIPGAEVVFVSGQWCYAGTAPQEGSVTLFFGNVCIGGDGHTPGFWSNQNGEAILAGDDPHWREVLNYYHLVNAQGNNFNLPGGSFAAAYGPFEDWIHANASENMAYKLSSHLAAMILNVTYSFVPANSLVYAPGAQSANSAGFTNLAELIAEADAELALHPVTPSGSPWRAYQEALKNALDAANNGRDFPQTVPCGIDC